MIRASAPYTSGWGSFVLLKIDHIRVAWGGSLSMLHRTVKGAYSLPCTEGTLDSLNGACIFTSLDLKSGYWQVELDEDSIPLTAFTVGPLGFYECVRMPFGLTNAPATFQRLMELCLGELHLDWCIIYLDDVIIFSKNPDDHITRLKGVFEKLAKAGLKLKPSKCKFFRVICSIWAI